MTSDRQETSVQHKCEEERGAVDWFFDGELWACCWCGATTWIDEHGSARYLTRECRGCDENTQHKLVARSFRGRDDEI